MSHLKSPPTPSEYHFEHADGFRPPLRYPQSNDDDMESATIEIAQKHLLKYKFLDENLARHAVRPFSRRQIELSFKGMELLEQELREQLPWNTKKIARTNADYENARNSLCSPWRAYFLATLKGANMFLSAQGYTTDRLLIVNGTGIGWTKLAVAHTYTALLGAVHEDLKRFGGAGSTDINTISRGVIDRMGFKKVIADITKAWADPAAEIAGGRGGDDLVKELRSWVLFPQETNQGIDANEQKGEDWDKENILFKPPTGRRTPRAKWPGPGPD